MIILIVYLTRVFTLTDLASFVILLQFASKFIRRTEDRNTSIVTGTLLTTFIVPSSFTTPRRTIENGTRITAITELTTVLIFLESTLTSTIYRWTNWENNNTSGKRNLSRNRFSIGCTSRYLETSRKLQLRLVLVLKKDLIYIIIIIFIIFIITIVIINIII